MSAADRRFRLVVDALPDPVVIVDPDLTVFFANLTACELMGHDLDEMRGRHLSESGLPPAFVDRWVHAFAEVFRTGEVRDLELRFSGPTGDRWFWTRLAPEPDDDGTVAKVVALGRDVTERVELERHLQDLARRDPLTGLANRRHLDDVLANALDRGGAGRGVAVLFCDLDGLKRVNDTHGHEIGDAVLVAFGRRLERASRASDTCFRLGGDEFVVVCEGVAGGAEAIATSRRVLGHLARPYAVGGLRLDVSASIGMVMIGPDEIDDVTPAEVLRDADQAMYHAKVHGGGTVATYDRVEHAPVLPAPL